MTRIRDTFVSLAVMAAISVTTATGVVALAADNYDNDRNSVVTGRGTFTHDLRGKAVDGAESCDDLGGYVQGQDLNALFDDLTMQYSGEFLTVLSSPLDFCIRNFGMAAVRVEVSMVDVVDIEDACSPDEETVGGDTTCGNDGDGELSPLIGYTATLLDPEGSAIDCTDTQAFRPFSDTLHVANLPPGERCRFSFSIGPLASTTSQRAAAQTDRVSWTMRFTATDF